MVCIIFALRIMPGIVDTKILLVTSLVTKLVLHQCILSRAGGWTTIYIVLTARVVREKGPLTLASGAQIWATNWFLYKKKDSGALFDPHLDCFRYLIVISLIA